MLSTQTRSRVEDFAVFCAAMRDAGDIDPLYPVLRHVLRDQRGLVGDDLVDALVVYVAYYHAPSALRVLDGERLDGPTGVERRGLRGGKVHRHLASVAAYRDRYGGAARWLQAGWVGDARRDWQATRRSFEDAWGNGRWASYKLCELLEVAAGWPITAPDMGMVGASGPLGGIRVLYPERDWTPPLAEEEGRRLRDWLASRGEPLRLSEVETCLCDFHSLAEGRYYVGHDAGMLVSATAALPLGAPRAQLETAIRESLPERHARPFDPSRRGVYRASGRLE